MNCPKCGTLNSKTSYFCYSCGAELSVKHEKKEFIKPIVFDNDEEIPVLLKPAENEMDNTKSVEIPSKDESVDKSIDEVKSQQIDSRDTPMLPKGVRIVLALLACFAIFVAHTLIGVALGWERGGGIIPMMIMFALWGFTWRAIVGKKKDE